MTDNIIYTEDYIVEQGISGIWTYRKWASGIAECWCKYTAGSITKLTAWGELFQSPIVSGNSNRIDYPFTFIEVPVETARVGGATYGLFVYTQSNGNPTTTQSGIYHLVRAADVTAKIDCTLDIHTIGRWK